MHNLLSLKLLVGHEKFRALQQGLYGRIFSSMEMFTKMKQKSLSELSYLWAKTEH